MFQILDGREYFYQWDLNQKLIVTDETVTEVHYCNGTDDCALVCLVYEQDGKHVVDVPNILLQTDWRIKVYAYCNDCYTKESAIFTVKKRNKPADYIYTETDVYEITKVITENATEVAIQATTELVNEAKEETIAQTQELINEATQEKIFELIEEFTITEATKYNFIKNTEPDGTPYNFKKVYIEIVAPKADADTIGTCSFNDAASLYFPKLLRTYTNGSVTKALCEVQNGMLFSDGASMVNVTSPVYSATEIQKYKFGFGGAFYNSIKRVQFQLSNNVKFPIGTVVKIYAVRA